MSTWRHANLRMVILVRTSFVNMYLRHNWRVCLGGSLQWVFKVAANDPSCSESDDISVIVHLEIEKPIFLEVLFGLFSELSRIRLCSPVSRFERSSLFSTVVFAVNASPPGRNEEFCPRRISVRLEWLAEQTGHHLHREWRIRSLWVFVMRGQTLE